jgi:hypothetical protein
VSQDITTSRVGDQTVGAQTDQSDNIKKRLGNLTAPIAAQTAPMHGGIDAATVNLGRGAVGATHQMSAPAGQITAPIGSTDSQMTARIGHLADSANVQQNGSNVTAPMAEPQTIQFAQSPGVATVSLQSNGQTSPALGTSGTVTAAMPAPEMDSTVPLGPTGATATVQHGSLARIAGGGQAAVRSGAARCRSRREASSFDRLPARRTQAR